MSFNVKHSLKRWMSINSIYGDARYSVLKRKNKSSLRHGNDTASLSLRDCAGWGNSKLIRRNYSAGTKRNHYAVRNISIKSLSVLINSEGRMKNKSGLQFTTMKTMAGSRTTIHISAKMRLAELKRNHLLRNCYFWTISSVTSQTKQRAR